MCFDDVDDDDAFDDIKLKIMLHNVSTCVMKKD